MTSESATINESHILCRNHNITSTCRIKRAYHDGRCNGFVEFNITVVATIISSISNEKQFGVVVKGAMVFYVCIIQCVVSRDTDLVD